MKEINRIVTTIKIRASLRDKVNKAIKNGVFPAGINDFSSAVEHLIEKELGKEANQ